MPAVLVQILERQIEELSDFLEDENKLKRTRGRSSGGGSTNNSVGGGSSYGTYPQPSSAIKKNKVYTPTTKLSFEF